MRHLWFWAKTLAQVDAGRPTYKPALHHMLDVAACARALLMGNPSRLGRAARVVRLETADYLDLCTLLAALHDLGKISRAFQFKAPELWPEAVLVQRPQNGVVPIVHWEATALLLQTPQVRKTLGVDFARAWLTDNVIAAIAGHHGRPPGSQVFNGGVKPAARHGGIGQVCVDVAAELAGELGALLAAPVADALPESRDAAFSFDLNGLITLADWLGSGEDFVFEPIDMPAAEYWALAQRRAAKAASNAGLNAASPKAIASVASLAGTEQASPRPMQALALDATLGMGPQLFVIEDGTGSGKTEAALILASRLMAAGHGEGVFVALPTMATANAMHARLERALPALFDEVGGRAATVTLSHGKSGVARRLRSAMSAPDRDQEGPVADRINRWIADSRKKAFFADVGAGTIDQAFLGILPKKHLTLRQHALAGRILIVDEAHAFDGYMGEELKVLLEMQARLGGSAIVLSATLPQRMRLNMIKAFARGCARAESNEGPASGDDIPYPLLTHFNAGNASIREAACRSDESLARTVFVERLPDRSAAIEEAFQAAEQGACVAIVCNAVDEAIAAWRAIATRLPEGKAHLFHARFAMGDRLAIERDTLARFGRESTKADRAGHVLVATQVVEQSLDLDFDLMISDLAPVDLLIQRAGRLWRHARADRPLSRPVLKVVSPDCDAPLTADWLKDALGSGAYVYRDAGVVWRTARRLFAAGRIRAPDDLRGLIEAVYGPGGEPTPEALSAQETKALGKHYSDATLGKTNTIAPAGGYLGVSVAGDDEEIGTRLGEPTLTIRLARREGSRLVPWCIADPDDDVLNWALSEVSVRTRWLGSPPPQPADAALVAATRTTWPEWEQAMPLYKVGDGGALQLAAKSQLAYDSAVGLFRALPHTRK
jgi:CRISPR-associated endonuclease/helicase Cas3